MLPDLHHPIPLPKDRPRYQRLDRIGLVWVTLCGDLVKYKEIAAFDDLDLPGPPATCAACILLKFAEDAANQKTLTENP